MISLIMSILSQDTVKDQLYKFVEKRNGELIEKKNRLRGTQVIGDHIIKDMKRKTEGLFT